MLIFGTVAPALVAGAMIAPAVATALSPLFPVGLARRFDPDPGLHADATVFVAGSLVLLLVLSVVATMSGARLVEQTARREIGHLGAPGLTDRVARWLRPPPATGLRFALSAPRTLSVPVRPALVGAFLGVLGLVGVAVVGTSLDRLVDTPARWGTPWDVAVGPDQLEGEGVLRWHSRRDRGPEPDRRDPGSISRPLAGRRRTALRMTDESSAGTVVVVGSSQRSAHLASGGRARRRVDPRSHDRARRHRAVQLPDGPPRAVLPRRPVIHAVCPGESAIPVRCRPPGCVSEPHLTRGLAHSSQVGGRAR